MLPADRHGTCGHRRPSNPSIPATASKSTSALLAASVISWLLSCSRHQQLTATFSVGARRRARRPTVSILRPLSDRAVLAAPLDEKLGTRPRLPAPFSAPLGEG